MAEIIGELQELRELLATELGQNRIDPSLLSVVRAERDSLREALEAEKKRSGESVKKMDRLNHELMESRRQCELLQERIEGLQSQVSEKEILQRRVDELSSKLRNVPSSGSAHNTASSGELEIERKRRVKAEQELDIYRRQGKTSEERMTANAKRVAVALAQHCLELSDELNRLRGKAVVPAAVIEHKAVAQKSPVVSHAQNVCVVEKQESTKTGNPATGWGVDDDDLFDDMN
jgi:SMC interacting uncharacterized protein involved in chromosome segregation